MIHVYLNCPGPCNTVKICIIIQSTKYCFVKLRPISSSFQTLGVAAMLVLDQYLNPIIRADLCFSGYSMNHQRFFYEFTRDSFCI